MKRFFPIIISVIMLCSLLFTGCSTGEETAVSTRDALTANHDLLLEAFPEGTDKITFDDFAAAVCAWADENEIKTYSANDKYLVLSKENSGELKNVESFTFHTAVNFDNEEESAASLSSSAAVMTALGNAQNHDTITGIFTLTENGQPVGAQAINPDYLDSDNFIDVTYSKDSVLYSTFAASSDMSAVKDLTITEPQYTKAYKIEFKGHENQSAYKNRGSYPNPVKAIGDLLASCQTSTILFELASFEGGTYSDQIPSEVTATIVLHENDVESFIKKFEKSYEKIEDTYSDLDNEEETFQYTINPVDLPSEVISKEDTENIVSLMYTMINGTYLRNDDDEVEAFSNIGKVSTSDGTFHLDINAKSISDEVMTELEGVVETICGLSDIGYEKSSSTAVWSNDPEAPLLTALSEAVNAECTSVLESKHVSALLKIKDDLNLVSWGTNLDDASKDLEKIFEYMSIAGAEELTQEKL